MFEIEIREEKNRICRVKHENRANNFDNLHIETQLLRHIM